jgi:imidazolonepropionase-like amidohydrolase
MSRKAWLALCVLACASWRAAPADAAKPVRVYAITGVRIVASPGHVIENGTIVVRDGLIEAAGAGVAVPADARVWDGAKLTAYAGLIDPYTVRAAGGEPKEGERAERGGRGAPSAAPEELVRPDRDVVPLLADNAATKKLRDAGFTTAAVAPKDGMFRGRSVVVELEDGAPQGGILRGDFAQNVTVRPSGARRSEEAYPASLMGAVALFRQTMSDASWYGKARAAYQKNARQERPAMDAGLEALQAAASGTELMVFETEDVLDALRDAKLVQEFKLKAALVGSGEEYKRLADVKALGLPILLPLAFPKAPEMEGDKDPNVDLAVLRHWDAAPENPKRVLDAGIDVAFTSFGLDDPKKIFENVAKAMKGGLTADQALNGLTVAPARFLGIQDRAGTIEAGKLANLVLVEGDLFVEKPKIQAVWVEGTRYEVKESKAAEIEPAGTWELTVKTGSGREIANVLELTGKAGALKGTLTANGKSVPVEAEVSGDKLNLSFDGAGLGLPGSFTMSLEIKDDNATGGGSGPNGGFSVTGTRTKKPGHGAEAVAEVIQ